MSLTTIVPTEPQVAAVTIADRARRVADDNNAVQLATLGGAWSPWILGAYFARVPSALRALPAESDHADLDLVLMLERHGKTYANLQIDRRVAFVVSKNDATCDFLQGSGVAELLAPEDEAHVMAALTGKMPWFKLYTPCMPVRVAVRELFVTSFELGWMPAKRLVVRSSPPA